jgi:MraZ protein
MLIGEFDGKLTDKNRLAIPKKVREELEEGLIISRGYEGCLLLLDKKRWLAFENLINTSSILSLSLRDTKRFILGGAYELELDAQGRFVLPLSLINYAKIESEVMFIAIKDWVEIWSKEAWERKLAQIIKTAPDLAEELLKIK